MLLTRGEWAVFIVPVCLIFVDSADILQAAGAWPRAVLSRLTQSNDLEYPAFPVQRSLASL